MGKTPFIQFPLRVFCGISLLVTVAGMNGVARAEPKSLTYTLPETLTTENSRENEALKVLQMPVSIGAGEKNTLDAIKEICRFVNERSEKIRFEPKGRLVSLLVADPQITSITASNEPARDVLDRLFKEMRVSAELPADKNGGSKDVRGTMLWKVSCFYDTNPNFLCEIESHPVAPPGTTNCCSLWPTQQ